MSEQTIRLTQYSHGAGCGCKISPKVLETILQSDQAKFIDPNLLVGNETSDDAAVYDLGNGTSIVSTTDFFMPIVDNPFDFGRIAATNAISDIFAMGGKPIMAIAILGWPINTLAPEIARQVVEGGRFACQQAGIALAGGHSIDAPEPIFGLAVTGVVPTERVKKNSTAQAGCKLYLTKPLGIGVLTTAEKKSLLKPEHQGLATETMCQMNLVGSAFAQQRLDKVNIQIVQTRAKIDKQRFIFRKVQNPLAQRFAGQLVARDINYGVLRLRNLCQQLVVPVLLAALNGDKRPLFVRLDECQTPAVIMGGVAQEDG